MQDRLHIEHVNTWMKRDIGTVDLMTQHALM